MWENFLKSELIQKLQIAMDPPAFVVVQYGGDTELETSADQTVNLNKKLNPILEPFCWFFLKRYETKNSFPKNYFDHFRWVFLNL